MKYFGVSEYVHGSAESLGILVANLGTPDAPTAPALRRYLRQFFDDRRVFEFPRLTWWLLTRAIILNNVRRARRRSTPKSGRSKARPC